LKYNKLAFSKPLIFTSKCQSQEKEELIDGVEVGGVVSYLEASEHADNNLFI